MFAFIAPAKSFSHSPYFLVRNNVDSIPAGWASKLAYREPSSAFTFTSKPPVDLSIYSKDSLAFIVDYKAKDSSVLLVQQNQFYLHKEAEIKNPDADISANTIEFNKNTNIVKFYGNSDSSNAISGRPTILQNGSKSILDSGYYNIKSQKGILKNTYYNEGEIFVQAAVAKKIDSNSIFVKDARFTTCNLSPPHFDLHAFKMKMISGKLAVSGPAIPEFEGVPMPIVIPFGIYPLTRGRHSGLLPAVFQQDNIKGLGLTGLGYYKVINDYWDVTTRVDLYSYGGYTINVNPNYYKRYAYRGNLNVSYQFTKTLNSYGNVAQEYTKNKTIHVGWSHSMDSKAHPGESFSASVNAGSTLYNSLQTLNPYQSFNNQLNSSITFAKNWDNGKYNLSVQANHSQNSVNHSINIQFPTLNFSTTTINPFQKKEMVGKPKWYENIGISYNGTFQNQLSFYDTVKNSIKSLLDTMQWGAQHQIPITLTLPAVGPLLFSPSVSYSENWISRKLISHWDSTLAKVDTTIEKGF
ncbi:putative LPS assembly protein LptD, partial [Arachidicoccus sp.]|uniref:putative LPS assembly protein LptD n=1 Tax=Arachidicoccus sp. TaxID=1872624 RepID=UPI003D23C077